MTVVDAEQSLLSCCYIDPGVIDRAVEAGISDQHFKTADLLAQWKILLALRTERRDCDTSSVFAEAEKTGKIQACGGIDRIVEASQFSPTSLNSRAVIDHMVSTHARREIYRRSTRITSICTDGGDLEEIVKLNEEIGGVTVGKKVQHRPLSEIGDSVLADARERMAGSLAKGKEVLTGLSGFDRLATSIERHEYALICARTSHGKSSLMAQMAHLNHSLGVKVVYYTLETSDSSVLSQMAAQYAGVYPKQLAEEMPEDQKKYMAEVEKLKGSNRLLIFDRILRLEELQAHARILSASYKPDVVFLDYLNLVGCKSKDSYEHMGVVSKAMIPLRKALDCPLIAGAQLNRGPEKDDRRPERTDLRDSGSLEEDAHRIIAIWRKPKQPLDNQYFDSELLQLKLRDGPLCAVDLKYYARTRKFFEVAKI